MTHGGGKTFSKTTMFFMTELQHTFIRLYAVKKKTSISKVLRACINKLMRENPALAKEAEELTKGA